MDRAYRRPASAREAGATPAPASSTARSAVPEPPAGLDVEARARLLGHNPQRFTIHRAPPPPPPPTSLGTAPFFGGHIQRANGKGEESSSSQSEEMDLGSGESEEGEDLEALAVEAWDAAVEQARSVTGLNFGIEVSVEEVETYFMTVEGIDNPREHDFELDDADELGAFYSELAQAVDSFPEEVQRRQELPTEAYARYSEIYSEEHPEKPKLDVERLKQNTTAFARFLQHHGMAVPVVLAQRSYPGMKDLAAENEAELFTAPGHLLNIHAEMLGLYLQMQSMVEHGLVNVMLQVHPSQPVCFFCEVMLRLFGVEFEPTFVDKRMFPGWVDPSGYFQTADQRYFTPRMMLELFGYNVKAAAARILPLFADVENPEEFVRRILDGELQGGELKGMIRDLKKASPALAEANAKARAGGGSRKPGKNTKAGRRALREQQKQARQRRQQREVSGKVDYPVEGLPPAANRQQWRRYLEQISVLTHTGNQLAAAIIEDINAHPEREDEILDRLSLGPGGAILGYLRGG